MLADIVFVCLIMAERRLTHSRLDLFRVFDIGFGQIEGNLGIILSKEFFKKSNKKLSYGNFHNETIH